MRFHCTLTEMPNGALMFNCISPGLGKIAKIIRINEVQNIFKSPAVGNFSSRMAKTLVKDKLT